MGSHPTFSGKTKTELSFEAFAKHGDNCTREQWEKYLENKGIPNTSGSLYYTVKGNVALMREAASKGLGQVAAKKYVAHKSKSQAFGEALYDEMLAMLASRTPAPATAPSAPAPATAPAEPRVESAVGRDHYLGDTLRRYHRFKSLVDSVGEDAVVQITDLVNEVGADGVNQMLDVYKELKPEEEEEGTPRRRPQEVATEA